jgi:hypothetical protein
LRLVRSEKAAEISALTAELIGAENQCNRAIADREQVESKLVEISRFDDGLESTFEFSGKRYFNDEASPDIRRDSGVSDLFRFLEYCGSIVTEGQALVDRMSRILFLKDNGCWRIWCTWDHLFIAAAVQSLKTHLIRKDPLISRNKELKDKLTEVLSLGCLQQSQSTSSVKHLRLNSNHRIKKFTTASVFKKS